MTNRIQQIAALGQSIWLDYISRDLLRSGELRKLVDEGLAGMTSNPTIFQKAISGSADYDDEIRSGVQRGWSTHEIYESLAVADICAAADQLRQVYDATGGRDGYISIEVRPTLAHDTGGTIEEGKRLFARIARPNVMIKVPATPAGLPAISALIAAGINVNVTLIFAIEMYEQVMQAYLDGLRSLRQAGGDVSRIASVASFFVSRVDTRIDADLLKLGKPAEEIRPLLGKAAIANAKAAYERYQAVFGGAGFADLRSAGARAQRPLWASTGTKNPEYPDTLYVDTLIGPDTVNTVPPQTLDALRARATPARTIDRDVAAAHQTLKGLAGCGIDMQRVTADLLADGVKSFSDSFAQLLDGLASKRAQIERAMQPA